MSAVGSHRGEVPAAALCVSIEFGSVARARRRERMRQRMSEATACETRGPVAEPLDALADAISAGLVVASADRIRWASERLVEMAGFGSASELLGRPLRDLFSDTGAGLPDCAARLSVECALKRVDGSLRSVRCRLADGAAGSEGFAWLIEDVTRVRTLERELLHASQQMHRVNREVEDLRERLRRETDEREELLGVVSHELRTPVTIISGYNRLLLSEKIGSLNDEQRSFLVESSKACRRLDLFIGNLLEASRRSSDGEVLEITHAELAPVVDEVVALLRPLFDEAKLEVRVDIADDADRARFDRTRLEQVLINLLGNAIKFSPPGGSIEIATRAVSHTRSGGLERPCVEFCVSDEGRGVEPAYRKRIFDPYVQLADEKGARGLGLGLAICKRLVEAHAGEISCEAGVERGSRFVFTIPVSSSADPAGMGDRS